jgi:two-component system, cell cycle response regulator DivK
MPEKPSVLVVEDNRDSREMLAEYLAALGFPVAAAANSDEALARAEEIRPRVVLMDLALPGTLDGWETTRRLKANPMLKHTVVIAVTANGLAAHREKAMHAGCHSVILKPYDLDALVARIEEVAHRKPR